MFIAMLVSSVTILAQTVIPEPSADFSIQKQGEAYLFSPILPAQQSIPGAPLPYYDYYWEFGDGAYSFDKTPQHTYTRNGSFDAQLWATGKYDKGKSPKTRPKRTEVSNQASHLASNIPGFPVAPREKTLNLRAVRNPRPGEEIVLIATYANLDEDLQSGELHLFYNQREYRQPHFSFVAARTHYGETEGAGPDIGFTPGFSTADHLWAGLDAGTYANWLSALPAAPNQLIQQSLTQYSQQKTWRFSNLKRGEKRNLFVSLQATEEMLADTNAIITVEGLYLGEDGKTAKVTLEMEILASHDPNNIAVSNKRISFRSVKGKDLDYKVNFQNNGEGPASTIQLTTGVPRGLEASGIKILDMYPFCPICPDEPAANLSCLDTSIQKDKLIFTFRNIYLPGSKQDGVGDRDSTKGFVKYSLEIGRKMKKYPFDSQASIVFDRNPPIMTNYASTRFKPGWSLGAMVGQNVFLNQPGLNSTFAGLTLSPFKPYKAYFQVEVFPATTGRMDFPEGGFILHQSTRQTTTQIGGRVLDVVVDSLIRANGPGHQEFQTLSAVPLQLRKNVNDWMGLGVGVMASVQTERFTASSYTIGRRTSFCKIDATGNCQKGDVFQELSFSREEKTFDRGDLTRWDFSVFADVQLGLVRRGPALGIRNVLRLTQEPRYYLTGYLSFKI
ncbi:pkd domain containing protein [Haliscomenobacter hydrossis DSM 1100]|uniref:Pkd domain containing protein n=2 Tax=Haliscomenobacter TaxID=2349 RepID=F4KVH4_HALH1|nr:pkd domain containing protein [Haliscomenobacter hydrossis DSM 1100]